MSIYITLLRAIEELESSLKNTTHDRAQLETDIQVLRDMVNTYDGRYES
jgi:hypothetical protein